MIYRIMLLGTGVESIDSFFQKLLDLIFGLIMYGGIITLAIGLVSLFYNMSEHGDPSRKVTAIWIIAAGVAGISIRLLIKHFTGV